MPKNNLVVDVKPRNESIIDILPKSLGLGAETTQSYSVILVASQYIGLPFLVTYPILGTVTQWGESG